MANIYQLSQELLSIIDIIEENGGEITPEIEEQLNITQESFRDKIKDYCNVVKHLQNDIIDIKAEKARLSDLQKSKEKTIERIKKVIIEAVEMFGDTTKAGGKFIDYGIGKVSIRNNQAVEVDEDSINGFINRYVAGLAWYDMQNQLDCSIIKPDELVRYANQSKDSDDELVDLNFSLEDVSKLDANIDLKISLKSLLESVTGFELAKALVRYGRFDIKASVDKNDIKREAKENHTMPTYAKLINNQSIIIK